MGYIYSNYNIKQFATNPNIKANVGKAANFIAKNLATEITMAVAWMIVNNISKSIASGDVEAWFSKLKNSGKLNIRKNLAEAKRAKQELKDFTEVTAEKLEPGQVIRHQSLGSEFLVTNVKSRNPDGSITLTYQFSNPEEFDLDDPNIKEPTDVTLSIKDMKQFYRVA